MNSEIVAKLNLINKNFYQTAGQIWNPSKNYYWEGWDKIFAILSDNKFCNDYQVLDAGCGNARFFNFLASKINDKRSFTYTGLDFSREMLENTLQINETNKKMAICDFVSEDILYFLQANKFQTSYNLISAFGVFHHIPGADNRLKLFEQLTKLLRPNGLLVFTTWQFLDVPRLCKRLIDRDAEYKQKVMQRLELSQNDLEHGDYILDWVKKVTAYRYAHYFEPDEIQIWLDTTNLELVKSFVSDGRSGRRNKYYVCKKQVQIS